MLRTDEPADHDQRPQHPRQHPLPLLGLLRRRRIRRHCRRGRRLLLRREDLPVLGPAVRLCWRRRRWERFGLSCNHLRWRWFQWGCGRGRGWRSRGRSRGRGRSNHRHRRPRRGRRGRRLRWDMFWSCGSSRRAVRRRLGPGRDRALGRTRIDIVALQRPRMRRRAARRRRRVRRGVGRPCASALEPARRLLLRPLLRPGLRLGSLYRAFRWWGLWFATCTQSAN